MTASLGSCLSLGGMRRKHWGEYVILEVLGPRVIRPYQMKLNISEQKRKPIKAFLFVKRSAGSGCTTSMRSQNSRPCVLNSGHSLPQTFRAKHIL